MAKHSRSSESESKKSGKKGRRGEAGQARFREVEEESGSEMPSVGQMLTENMPAEAREGIERVSNEVRRYFDRTKEYVSDNPREAAVLAAAAGMVTWAILGTKPGRQLFEASATMVTPAVSRWFSRQLSGATSH